MTQGRNGIKGIEQRTYLLISDTQIIYLFMPSPSAPPLEGRRLRLNEPCSSVPLQTSLKTLRKQKRDEHTLFGENSFRVNENGSWTFFSFLFFSLDFSFLWLQIDSAHSLSPVSMCRSLPPLLLLPPLPRLRLKLKQEKDPKLVRV